MIFGVKANLISAGKRGVAAKNLTNVCKVRRLVRHKLEEFEIELVLLDGIELPLLSLLEDGKIVSQRANLLGLHCRHVALVLGLLESAPAPGIVFLQEAVEAQKGLGQL